MSYYPPPRQPPIKKTTVLPLKTFTLFQLNFCRHCYLLLREYVVPILNR